MVFMDSMHKDFYLKCISRANAGNDPYRKALFYTLGLTDETRRNIDSLYDFDECGIKFDELREGVSYVLLEQLQTIDTARLLPLSSGVDSSCYTKNTSDPTRQSAKPLVQRVLTHSCWSS